MQKYVTCSIHAVRSMYMTALQDGDGLAKLSPVSTPFRKQPVQVAGIRGGVYDCATCKRNTMYRGLPQHAAAFDR